MTMYKRATSKYSPVCSNEYVVMVNTLLPNTFLIRACLKTSILLNCSLKR